MALISQFPQKAQGSPTVMEVSGDAPDWAKSLVSQLRFTKIFTRWFNSVVFQLEEDLNIKLLDPVQLPADPVQLYVSTNMRTNLSIVTLSNTTGSGRTVNLWIVPAGGARDAAHVALWEKAVAANTTVTASEVAGQALEDGDELWGSSDTADSVSCAVSGTKERLA